MYEASQASNYFYKIKRPVKASTFKAKFIEKTGFRAEEFDPCSNASCAPLETQDPKEKKKAQDALLRHSALTAAWQLFLYSETFKGGFSKFDWILHRHRLKFKNELKGPYAMSWILVTPVALLAHIVSLMEANPEDADKINSAARAFIDPSTKGEPRIGTFKHMIHSLKHVNFPSISKPQEYQDAFKCLGDVR